MSLITIQKPQLYIHLISAGIALFYLYFLLPIREIVIYPGSELKAILLHLVLFAFLYFSHVHAVSMLSAKDTIRAVVLVILSALLALVLTFFISTSTLFEPAMNEVSGVRSDYIVFGDYLRDVHGLNIYYFDISGWILVKYALICVFLFAVLSRVISKVFREQKAV